MNEIAEELFNPLLVLEDDRVKLRIIKPEDIPFLKDIALDPSIWKHFVTEINSEEDLVVKASPKTVAFISIK